MWHKGLRQNGLPEDECLQAPRDASELRHSPWLSIQSVQAVARYRQGQQERQAFEKQKKGRRIGLMRRGTGVSTRFLTCSSGKELTARGI